LHEGSERRVPPTLFYRFPLAENLFTVSLAAPSGRGYLSPLQQLAAIIGSGQWKRKC
jgi:hypothetical protein